MSSSHMDSLFDVVTTDVPAQDAGGDPALELTTLWKPSTGEQVGTEIDQLRQQTLTQNNMISQLIAQNTATNTAMAATQQQLASLHDLVKSGAAPAPTAKADTANAATDWAAIIREATGAAAPATTTTAASGTPAAPQPAPVEVVRSLVRNELQARDNSMAEVQRQSSQCYEHFKANHTDLHPHFNMVKDRFYLETQLGRPIGDAYNAAVLHVKQLLPHLKNPTTPAGYPSGGSGGGNYGDMPGMTQATARESVTDMAGQRYPIIKYLNGEVPLVEYTDKQENVHLNRYIDYRNDVRDVKKGNADPRILDAYPEHLALRR